jgi:hypothetical protein
MLTAYYKNWTTGDEIHKEMKNRKAVFKYLENSEDDLELMDYQYKNDHIGFVNVYEVTREYGGAEEGGWYYNSLRCLESIPCQHGYASDIIEWAKEEYAHIKHGNIYSVLGGAELEVMWEDSPCESETRNRPHYE